VNGRGYDLQRRKDWLWAKMVFGSNLPEKLDGRRNWHATKICWQKTKKTGGLATKGKVLPVAGNAKERGGCRGGTRMRKGGVCTWPWSAEKKRKFLSRDGKKRDWRILQGF